MNDWFDMGGYELYVWGSIGCTLAVLAWNLWAPAAHRRELLREEPDSEEDHTEDAA